MMKNKMMRVASVLLVAVLLSTCAISGTFAKYVTSNDASDNARVAKFGVVIQADGSLYGTYYDTTFKPSTTDTAASLYVMSSVTTENVVAPGTQSDEGLYFSLTGTPEVRTQLTATITSENIFLAAGTYAVMVPAPTVSATSWKENTYYTAATVGNVTTYTLSTEYDADATYYTMQDYVTLSAAYYPVVYKATDLTTGTTASDSLNAIAAYYAQQLNGGTAVNGQTADTKTTYTINNKEYDPNKDYSTLGVAGETITWEWAFDGNDEADTILGHLQAGADVVKVDTTNNTATAPTEHTDYNLETSFGIEITVTQVSSNGAAVTEAPSNDDDEGV